MDLELETLAVWTCKQAVCVTRRGCASKYLRPTDGFSDSWKELILGTFKPHYSETRFKPLKLRMYVHNFYFAQFERARCLNLKQFPTRALPVGHLSSPHTVIEWLNLSAPGMSGAIAGGACSKIRR